MATKTSDYLAEGHGTGTTTNKQERNNTTTAEENYIPWAATLLNSQNKSHHFFSPSYINELVAIQPCPTPHIQINWLVVTSNRSSRMFIKQPSYPCDRSHRIVLAIGPHFLKPMWLSWPASVVARGVRDTPQFEALCLIIWPWSSRISEFKLSLIFCMRYLSDRRFWVFNSSSHSSSFFFLLHLLAAKRPLSRRSLRVSSGGRLDGFLPLRRRCFPIPSCGGCAAKIP